MEQRRRTLPVVLGALALLTGCGPVAIGGPAPGDVSAAPAPGSPAADVLASLTVKGRAAMTGYDRDRFGPTWSDVDRNGCDTRNDVLARDLAGATFRAGTHDCVVVTGTLADPYTGSTVDFRKGDGSSVDIDHVVALGDAWQTGAQRWDDDRRRALANDPLNLLAVGYSANRQKGDADAASWLPPARGYRCDYVARQVAVKAAYGLWVTPAERDAIARVLTGCPDQAVPAADQPAPVPADVPAGPPTPFPDCAAAREAGAAPLHAGDPGYSRALDRDGDGTACE
ncbi:DUF1524 domain-containing protein [Modestobacter sp. NPDC049651]|uniref:GmrSD restriction endonuclease domain-containing protein n=1 Tax=unclassified Modestobacter TaxID=2643866 RepID=UPI0033EF3329